MCLVLISSFEWLLSCLKLRHCSLSQMGCQQTYGLDGSVVTHLTITCINLLLRVSLRVPSGKAMLSGIADKG